MSETSANKDIEEPQKSEQDKKDEVVKTIFALSDNAVSSLMFLLFETSPDNKLIVDQSGSLLPKSVDWGRRSSLQISRLVSGVVELQQAIINNLKERQTNTT